MKACGACGREFVARKGPYSECPYCGWRQGSSRYWLDRDPKAMLHEVSSPLTTDGPLYDYPESTLKEWR